MSGAQVVDSGRSEFGIYSLVRLSLLSLHVFLRKIGILLHTLKIIMHIINHMTPSSPDLSPDFQIHTSSCLFELLIFLLNCSFLSQLIAVLVAQPKTLDRTVVLVPSLFLILPTWSSRKSVDSIFKI